MTTPVGDAFLHTWREAVTTRSGIHELSGHLEARYGIRVTATVPMDVGVFRVERGDGPPWVARVHQQARPLTDVEGDARILLALERQGFPSERCAADPPVSSHQGQGVLVTGFVPGQRADGRGRTFGALGSLLGRLHARSGQTAARLRSGGAWHHLVAQGSPEQEIEAAIELVEQLRPGLGPADRSLHRALTSELAHLDTCDGLPEALLHPDFVPANAIVGPDDRLVMVDWTGAGRGPRLWSLAFLLWAAGVRDLRLVDTAVTHYGRHVRPREDELDRLSAAVRARPSILACWGLCAGRKGLSEVREEIGWTRRMGEVIAARARRGFAALPAADPAAG